MRLTSHPNIVELQAFFYSNGEKKDEVFLNLVLEFVPETIYRASRHYSKIKQTMPMLSIKVSYKKSSSSYLLSVLAVHVSNIPFIGIHPCAWYMPSRHQTSKFGNIIPFESLM